LGETRPSITTKQDLIAYTATAWDAFVACVDGLPDDRWTGPKDAAGWSVKDHVAHVTNWDRAVIEQLRNGMPMQATLGISDAAWSADSWDPMNDEIRRLAVDDSVQAVKAARDATWADLVALLGELGEDQLARPGAEAGLGVGERPLSEPVLQVLADYWGGHYGGHLACIKAIVEGDPA
jgi:hypothetical protein